MRYGDGWIPHLHRPQYEDVTGFLPQFRAMAREAGRDPAALPVTVWGFTEDRDRLSSYRDQGVARVIIRLDSANADAILPVLDRWAALIRASER